MCFDVHFRAETVIGNIIFRSQDGDPGSSKLTALLQFDLKGRLPTAMVNSKSAGGPVNTYKAVRSFYDSTYKAELAARAAGK
ncbi:MAG: START domain-containing protein [Bacteroidota bacterium]